MVSASPVFTVHVLHNCATIKQKYVLTVLQIPSGSASREPTFGLNGGGGGQRVGGGDLFPYATCPEYWNYTYPWLT